ncbi:hypothetical protein DIDNDMLP_00507 [Klebsiella phage KP13-7]|uniref:Uncharacterized protein n=1 Tax=Klebsiella phage vB_KleM_RaK2 TaxID=1147094 RepID=H6X3L4_9CAUD|nr:hypothetical protein F403_gp478 [Klebsiella phage vB_KleM_RaK2]YP_010842947.1 hypothetical protein ACQ27_gp063 [Klebsiella phage K64-1]AFA44330.1 hypothetical protein RaK2_00057 [Klebsiella phage vB_KleM_RaK2]QOE32467.1 hypothetical protein CPT_Muenster_295 [Klebsiella phage Muenster]UYL05492.1 hypothetical protein DIDNDMLP_00507 [Klebsiella phage KP13-7]
MPTISIEEIILMLKEERQKQIHSPNTLGDTNKTKNDWTALCAYYLFEGASRPDKHVSFDEFRTSLIKAGAVIIAALETSFALEDEKLKDLMNKLENNHDEE